jgi:hypothetical protein
LAEKILQIVVEGLSRALADPGGQPLHGTKVVPGLFATTGPAKQAAQQCRDAGYLQLVRTETKGKTIQEICAITETGIAFLLSQVSPKQVLEDLVRALDARGRQVGELVETAKHWQATFTTLRSQVEKVLAEVRPPLMPVPSAHAPGTNGVGPWKTDVLAFLADWPRTHPNEDCPLPELYRRAAQACPGLTLGQFHDGLRQLQEQEQIYLHPWTGPLYEIAEPTFALVSGHAVAYYASRKTQ